MNQRVAHLTLDAQNTLVVPTPRRLCLRIPLSRAISGPVRYLLQVDGEPSEGYLNSRHEANLELPPGSSVAEFSLWPFGDQGDPFTWQLQLGQLPAIETLQGVQSRLNNLGLDAGPVDGLMGSQTRGAVKRFQIAHKLTVDGNPGEHTRAALKESHGC